MPFTHSFLEVLCIVLPIDLLTKIFLFSRMDSTLGLLFVLFQGRACSKASFGLQLIKGLTNPLLEGRTVSMYTDMASHLFSMTSSPLYFSNQGTNIPPLFCEAPALKKGVSHHLSYTSCTDMIESTLFRQKLYEVEVHPPPHGCESSRTVRF